MCMQHMTTQSRVLRLLPTKCSHHGQHLQRAAFAMSLRNACPQAKTRSRNTSSQAPDKPSPWLTEGPPEMQTSLRCMGLFQTWHKTGNSTQSPCTSLRDSLGVLMEHAPFLQPRRISHKTKHDRQQATEATTNRTNTHAVANFESQFWSRELTLCLLAGCETGCWLGLAGAGWPL